MDRGKTPALTECADFKHRDHTVRQPCATPRNSTHLPSSVAVGWLTDVSTPGIGAHNMLWRSALVRRGQSSTYLKYGPVITPDMTLRCEWSTGRGSFTPAVEGLATRGSPLNLPLVVSAVSCILPGLVHAPKEPYSNAEEDAHAVEQPVAAQASVGHGAAAACGGDGSGGESESECKCKSCDVVRSRWMGCRFGGSGVTKEKQEGAQ